VTLDALLQTMPRVDALNSYVRSPSYRGGLSGNLKRVIYHYKREALKSATNLQIVSHRRVWARSKCIDCNGKGRYTDYNGYTHPHCRKCYSTGSVKLQFIESTIAAASIVWHSPERDCYDFLPIGWLEWPEESAGDWAPHQPGKDLTADELAKHLLEVEGFFPNKPRRYFWDDYYGGGSYYYPFEDYEIYVGDSCDLGCVICGNQENVRQGGYGVHTRRLSWTAHICEPCHVRYEKSWGKESTYIFRVLAEHFPEVWWTPALRQWDEMHPVRDRRAA
jgi:hypothetical protein